MKKLNLLLLLAALALATTFTVRADDAKAPTPDKLTTCPVSGDKLDSDMGAPFVFTYKDQEVKLCCKSCKKDFDKDPEKYMAKIRAADKTDKN
jgi:YHS domain-containing protein